MFNERLQDYLASRGLPQSFDVLRADASTREYFRISFSGRSAIACVYPEPFDEAEQSYLDVTNLLRSYGLPVAEIYDFDGGTGVIVQEDLGDQLLSDEIAAAAASRREGLITEAIGLIPRIQLATAGAFETDSIASRLKFDKEKLLWELNYFKEHYFTTLKRQPLAPKVDAAITAEFSELCEDLESRAAVLCHRDFHAANLMIDGESRLRIIDHQDARIGSVTYDLVSFLLDRVTEPPSPEWLAEKRRRFLAARENLGLPAIDEYHFAEEFRLQSVQRCLKAVGTFSFQSVKRRKTYFVPFIRPMFQIVLRTVGDIQRFPQLRSTLTREIRP